MKKLIKLSVILIILFISTSCNNELGPVSHAEPTEPVPIESSKTYTIECINNYGETYRTYIAKSMSSHNSYIEFIDVKTNTQMYITVPVIITKN